MITEKFVKFCDEVRIALEVRTGYIAEIAPVIKNNGMSLTGITLKKSDMCPTVYLEAYYRDYCNNIYDIDAIVDSILETINNNSEIESEAFSEVSKIQSWEYAKDRIFYKLVNKKKNTELLKSIPWGEVPGMEDLVLIYVIIMGKDKEFSCKVTNQLLDVWDIDMDTLSYVACNNTPKLFPAVIHPISNILNNVTSDSEMAPNGFNLPDGMPELFVLTNTRETYGAATGCYDGVFLDFANMILDDFYILPSSVHELILVPSETIPDDDYMSLKMMVSQVNSSGEVNEDDLLSDNIYFYSRNTRNVTML